MRFLIAILTSAFLPCAFAADRPADIWSAQCQSCHGLDGQAKTAMGKKEMIADFSNPQWQKTHSDASIRDVIANGSTRNKKMKAYKDKFTPAEIDSLVAYIRQMKK